MEEDRDRQKKAREESWQRDPDPSIEFQKAWKKAHPLTAKDYEIFEKYKKRFESSKQETVQKS